MTDTCDLCWSIIFAGVVIHEKWHNLSRWPPFFIIYFSCFGGDFEMAFITWGDVGVASLPEERKQLHPEALLQHQDTSRLHDRFDIYSKVLQRTDEMEDKPGTRWVGSPRGASSFPGGKEKASEMCSKPTFTRNTQPNRIQTDRFCI